MTSSGFDLLLECLPLSFSVLEDTWLRLASFMGNCCCTGAWGEGRVGLCMEVCVDGATPPAVPCANFIGNICWTPPGDSFWLLLELVWEDWLLEMDSLFAGLRLVASFVGSCCRNAFSLLLCAIRTSFVALRRCTGSSTLRNDALLSVDFMLSAFPASFGSDMLALASSGLTSDARRSSSLLGGVIVLRKCVMLMLSTEPVAMLPEACVACLW